LLGSEEFRSRIVPLLADAAQQREIPLSQRQVGRPSLQQLFTKKAVKEERNSNILAAINQWGYTQKEVADHLGLHYSTVSRIMGLLDHRGAEAATPSPRGELTVVAASPAPSRPEPAEEVTGSLSSQPESMDAVAASAPPPMGRDQEKKPRKRGQGEGDTAPAGVKQLSLF
jgi:ParB-like chromosome segregation protein Spo0J